MKIITRRWWLFLLLPVVTVVAIWAIGSTAEPEYVAYERLQIIPSDAQLVTLFSRTPTLTTEQQIQSVHDDFYDVVRLPAVAWKTIADLNLNMSASELIDRIDTEHFSTFITVSARMPEPELARDVVTVHTQNAIEYLRKIRVNPAEVTKKFLDEQVAQQEQVLAQARLALQQFQLEHEVSDLPKEIAAAEDMKRVLTAERDRLLAQAAQAEALAAQYDKMAEANRAKAAELTSLLPRTLITNTAAITDTTGVELPDEVLTTQQQIENLTALAAAQARQAQEQKALAAGKRAAAEDYNRIINERQQEIIFLLGLQEQYQALLNRLNQAQGTYDFLVDKANEANLKVVQGSTVGYLEVVSPARTPTAPAPKHLWQLMLVGILSSLLLALLLAFLIEILERHLLRK
ncbi:MAG TPA: hypothetical protein ENK60_08145 [Anaerolineae bacterium]|nr:hypothetical protein [Anaerolineae bacterium]